VKKQKAHRLGDLQLRIMQVLWARTEATVAEVFEEISKQSELAYTTVATMLRKMETRGLVIHRSEGRSFVYRPKVAAEAVSRGMIDHLIDRMFEGSLTAAVNHLLTTRDVSPEELKQLERLIAQRKKAK
jgi:BlaI family transcriptional regulator, penicillinase repressor